jgi:two-component system, NarL family, nitrate/nitrite sensor histidine kinase NarX
MVNGSNHVEPRESTLRSRLLIRLAGLLLILFILGLVVLAMQPRPFSAEIRASLTVLLLISGTLLAYSVLSLVQHNLLGPLSNIRAWARDIRQGTYTDRIPTPSYGPFAELADDLNSLGQKLQSLRNNRLGGMSEGENSEQKSLQILYEVVSSINTAHGLDDLMNRFLFTLKRITKAHAAAIWVMQQPSLVELAASSGIDESLVQRDRPEIRRCLYERALTEGKIWVEKNLDKCEKIAGRAFFDHRNIGLVAIPMRYQGRIIGIINLFLETALIEQLDRMKPLLTSVGHHLSVAIERARSDEQTHQHLINDERTRIAHELHDSLAQNLASLRYQVRVLDETLHQGDESTTWQQLERIENSLDEANAELRELIANFRSPVSNRSLIGAIEQTVNHFRSETRIKTYLQKEWTGDRLSKEVEIHILRIIQEALWNIRKHSQAKAVRIMLRHRDNENYHILIEDDGVGFDGKVYGSPGEHVGLSIMRERAQRIGGRLRVESEPGEGTRVVLELEDTKPEGGVA